MPFQYAKSGLLTRCIIDSIGPLMTLKGKTIVLGITGGIAAYKCCELTRELVKSGADVHVILTKAAEHFVTPLTLQTLSDNPVYSDMFQSLATSNQQPATQHISLADMADLLLVAPASANTIAKVAHGLCDDLLSTTICATKAPVVFAPSMNVNMWENPITQGNIKHLKNLKYYFIDPEEGELACGYRGVGRLADLKKIVSTVEHVIANPE